MATMRTIAFVIGVTCAVSAALGAEGAERSSLWGLFIESFDLFTILLLAGSLVGIATVFVCVFDVREKNIAPAATGARLLDLARSQRWEDLERALSEEDTVLTRVLRPAISLRGSGRLAIRDAAELAASEETARWFRKIDLLNLIGNLGPLIGLAGTVWGMILAFTSLGDTGGQAGPADLSLGISKALFHTLLGLCLAIPCLLAFGIYRNIVDKLCTRAIVIAGEIVERIPARDEETPKA